MSIAFNRNATREYVLKSDTSETKTIFVLGLFDLFVHAKLVRELPTTDTEKFNLIEHPEFMFDLLRHGLRGWKNLVDESGQLVEFKTDEKEVSGVGKRTIVSDDSLLQLNLLQAVEIAMEVIKDNFLSSLEKKS
jgi:hypothetical protein